MNSNAFLDGVGGLAQSHRKRLAVDERVREAFKEGRNALLQDLRTTVNSLRQVFRESGFSVEPYGNFRGEGLDVGWNTWNYSLDFSLDAETCTVEVQVATGTKQYRERVAPNGDAARAAAARLLERAFADEPVLKQG